MAEYLFTSENSQTFSLVKDGMVMGALNYPHWYSFNAYFIAEGKEYKFVSKGFWGSTIELQQSSYPILEFKMGWHGIVIHPSGSSDESGFIVKQKGFLNSVFVLTNTQGQDLISMKPQFQWKKFEHDYIVTTSDAFEQNPDKIILLYTMLHCVNYYTAVTVGAAV